MRIGEPDERWPWTVWLNRKGYGVYNAWNSRKKQYIQYCTHRIAYVLHTGREPANCVLHICNYAACCNAKHLYDGTDKENARDREIHNPHFHPRGSHIKQAKLTEAIVANIKERLQQPNVNMSAIAREYSVTQRVIRCIRDGLTWRHVQTE